MSPLKDPDVGEARVSPLEDPVAEHLATRRAVGLFDFSFMGLYEIGGREAELYLRAIQVRIPSLLAPGQIAYTLLRGNGTLCHSGRSDSKATLRHSGRSDRSSDPESIFIDATLWRLEEDKWWLFSGRRSDFAWLVDHSRGYGIELDDLSGRFAVLALQGPRSGRVLADVTGEDPVGELRYFRFRDAMLGAIPARIGRLGFSGELGYEIIVPVDASSEAWQLLRDAGSHHGIRECSFAAANSLRIESGYVLFDREITGNESAAELGLERLTGSTGREPSRRLMGLELCDQPVVAFTPLHLPLAQATSECLSPIFGKRIALGFVPQEAAFPGTSVRLIDGRVARVARLPFYDPARHLPRVKPL